MNSAGTGTCASHRCSRCRRSASPASGAAAAAATVAPAPSVRRNSRRPSALLRALGFFFHRRNLLCSRLAHGPIGQVRPDLRARAAHVGSANASVSMFTNRRPSAPTPTIEIGGLGLFQIGEETPDPGARCASNNSRSAPGGASEPAARKAGHDLAQDGGVIFRLSLTGRSFDSKLAEILAQARERTLVQKTGQVVGSVWQQFSASEADEEIEILALDALARGAARAPSASAACASPGGLASPRNVAETLEQSRDRARVRAARTAAQYSWARPASSVIDVAVRSLGVTPVEIRAAGSSGSRRLPPQPKAPARRECEPSSIPKAAQMPIFRASAPTPPATRIASSRPVIPHGRVFFFIPVRLYRNTAR